MKKRIKDVSNDVNFVYNTLVDDGYFTEEELNLITNINGYTVETLNDCIYARYGYHSLEQLLGEEEEIEISEDSLEEINKKVC